MTVRLAALALLLAGCEPTATVGMYTDAGARCDPLAAACGDAMACTLRSDPALDACRPVEGLASGASCGAPDACSSGSQCVSLGPSGASFDPGVCARLCARDAPRCEPAERCIGLLAAGGAVRVDYGVCAR